MILSFRRNRIRNTYIVGELKIEGKENEIKTNGLERFGQVKRMDQNKIPNRLLEIKMWRGSKARSCHNK
jgi:hypothetical protein